MSNEKISDQPYVSKLPIKVVLKTNSAENPQQDILSNDQTQEEEGSYVFVTISSLSHELEMAYSFNLQTKVSQGKEIRMITKNFILETVLDAFLEEHPLPPNASRSLDYWGLKLVPFREEEIQKEKAQNRRLSSKLIRKRDAERATWMNQKATLAENSVKDGVK
jgi:hypothetical protein